MLTCFLYETEGAAKFNSAINLIIHLKSFHGALSIFKFKCGQNKCKQTFQNIYTFKKHLVNHEKNADSQSNKLYKIDDKQKFHKNIKLSSALCQINHVEPNSASTSCLNNEIVKESPRDDQCNFDEQIKQIQESIIAFSLNLHSLPNLNRKNILDIQNLNAVCLNRLN